MTVKASSNSRHGPCLPLRDHLIPSAFASLLPNISYKSLSNFHDDRKKTPSNKPCHFFFLPCLFIYNCISFGKAHCGCKDEGAFRSKLPRGLVRSILSFSFPVSSPFQIISSHSPHWTKMTHP